MAFTRLPDLNSGTGASAIYPLLACKLQKDWKLIGTDVDEKSFVSAGKNVATNGLQDRITLWRSKPDDHIFAPIFAGPDQVFSFTMCNPPFYSTYSEAVNSPVVKEFDPFAVCTGAQVEMVTEGGEVGFVRRMILESTEIGERCRWYTSLLGKSSSVSSLVGTLRQHNVSNYGVTEFVQSFTRRWVILWSFGDIRLPDALCRVTKSQFAGLLPLSNDLAQPILKGSVEGVIKSTIEVLQSLPSVRWTQKSRLDSSQPTTLIATASANCWSRAARRKAGTFTPDGPAVLTCNFTIALVEADSNVTLHCQWVRGRERDLFESFWSHVSRKVVDMQ